MVIVKTTVNASLINLQKDNEKHLRQKMLVPGIAKIWLSPKFSELILDARTKFEQFQISAN